MAAVNGLQQVALLNVGGHAGGGAAALDVDDDQGHFRHGGPAEGFHFQRETWAGAAGDGEVACVGETDGGGDSGDLVFALDKEAAVFRQFGAEGLHNGGPRCDRVTGAVADAGGEEAVSERLVAIHGDLRTAAGPRGEIDGFEAIEQVVEIILGPRVTGVEGEHGVADNVFVLTAKTLLDEGG